ncbi:MAG: PHP domain-containing protein [Halanaerobiales bacterium]
MNCTGDFHTHSQYSHGKGNLIGNIEVAVSKGLKKIAITDHGPRTWNIIKLGVKSAEILLEIKDKIKGLQLNYPEIEILAGVEANIINSDGELDVPEDILSELDIVAAGFHLLLLPPNIRSAKEIIFDNRFSYHLFPARRQEIRKQNTRALINAVKRYNIDFITHPGYGVDIDTYELARVCTEENTFLEINARHGELTKGFVRAAAETDVKFIINSDAHSPDEVGDLNDGLMIVAELGLSADRIVNVEY